MSRAGWYARRLRAMDAREVAWRATSLAGAAARELATRPPLSASGVLGPLSWADLLDRFRAGTDRPVLLDRARAAGLAARHPEAVQALLDAADRAAAHRFAFFGRPEAQLSDPVDWHLDAATGHRWPAVPATRIDHRTHGGDAKWIWELNRLQHLPWLAQAWLVTGEQRHADAALRQLESWLAQNPPGVGIAWRGAFEAGVRATSVAIALQGLRDAPGLTPELFGGAVLMLAESARRCWRDRSRFSSANNHLVGELGGLLTVALLFPELVPARAWRRLGLAALAAEHRQILPDGAGAEQSLGYHLYVADVFCLVIALLRARGDAAPPRLAAAVQRSARYLAELVDGAERVPRYGDDDGSFAVRLDAAPVREVRAHLLTAAAVLGEPGGEDLVAGWLGGAAPRAPKHERPQPVREPGLFAPHGGLVVLRAGRRRVTMDVGPLGYLSLAAHGHADALALTLMVDGRELVTDPGTGSYYGDPQWRAEHRGTPLHATVCVDGLDQSVAAGPFLWSRHAAVTVRHVDLAAGAVCAEHDGYRRLDPPVTHRRWLWAPPDQDALVVVDLVDGAGRHGAATSWPLHPELHVEPAEQGHLAFLDGRPALSIATACTRPATAYAVRGASGLEDEGVGGWWSDRLERRVPAWRVGSRTAIDGLVVFATLLGDLRGRSTGPSGVRVSAAGDEADVEWTAGERTHLLRVDLTGRVPLAAAVASPEEGGR